MQKKLRNIDKSSKVTDWKALYIIITQPKYLLKFMAFSLFFLASVIWISSFQVIMTTFQQAPRETISLMLDIIFNFIQYFSISTPLFLLAIAIVQGLSLAVLSFIRSHKKLTLKYLAIFSFSTLASVILCIIRILLDSFISFEAGLNIFWSEVSSSAFLAVILFYNIFILYLLTKKSVIIITSIINNKTKDENHQEN